MANQPKSEVAQLFAEEGVVLVHCSSRVRMAGADRNTPLGRLKHVLDTKCDVPASTIRVGDTYVHRKYLGHLGLILDPDSFDNISVSWHEDAGSDINPEDGRRRSYKGLGHNSIDQVARAIRERGKAGVQTQHNEICCFGFQVVGLFADTEQPCFQMKAPLPGNEQDENEIQEWRAEGGVQFGWDKIFQYHINTVGARFPDLPLFLWQPQTGTFLVKKFNEASMSFTNNGDPPIAIADVYDCEERF